jgi:two-component system cell cycle sensor histidine kinase/response regulator CckA
MNDEGISLRGYRLLGFIAGLLTLSFGVVEGHRDLGRPLPAGERVGVAVILFVYVLLTWVVPWVRAHAGLLFRALLTGVAIWSTTGAARFGLGFVDALGMLVATFLIGLVFPTSFSVLGFYAVMTLAAGVAAAVAPVRQVDTAVLVGVMATAGIATFFVARARDLARAEIAELLLLAGGIHNGVVVLDRGGRVRRANEGFARLLGVAPTPGRLYTDLLAVPPTEPEAGVRLARMMETGTGGTVEFAHARSDGTPVWVAADVTPVAAVDGGTGGFVVVLSDTTRARATVTQILEAMSDALFIVGGDGRVEAVNPAACRLLDSDAAALVGSRLEGLVVPHWRWSEGLEAVAASIPGSGADLLGLLVQGELDEGSIRDLDLALRGPTGLVVPVLAAASLLPAEGDAPRRLVLVARDARERRRLEEQQAQLSRRVQEAQKLESLGILAGGIAHDFNNLLVGILGNASLALERLPATSPVRPLIENVDRSAQRAADLTRQMLAYAGKGRFVIEAVDLGALVDEMAELLDASLSKRAQLTMRLDPSIPPVEGDPTQLRQLVMNLLTNASDALGERDGAVTVSTFLDVPTVGPDGLHGVDVRGQRCVCIEVRDTGVGMDETVRQRMFDPFFTTKTRGRGLGLAATLGIVRAHGGAVHVASEPGRGTTIRAWFPASDRGLTVAEPLPPPVPMSERGVALVVDDEDHVREFIAAVLESTGLEIVQAVDGEAAVDVVRARGREIAVVVLDLTMPIMGGDEAFHAIHELRPDLPVLLSSGFSEQDARKRFGARGLAGFLQKPYRAAALLDAVRRVIGAPGHRDAGADR